MKQTKLLTVAVIGLLLLNLLTLGLLWFRPGPPGRAGGPEGDGPARIIIDRLRFDADQQRAYRALINNHRPQADTLAAQSARLYQAYYGLLTATTPDTAQARRLSGQIATTQQRLADVNFRHFGDIKRLCRPEQQADFIRLVEDLGVLFSRSGHGRPGHGRPGHDGPGHEKFRPRP